MSFAVQPLGAVNPTAPCQSPQPGFSGATFGHTGNDTCQFSSSSQKGSRSNIGMITGALACCALPFFALGALVALAGAATLRRSFNTVKSFGALIPPGTFTPTPLNRIN